MAIKEEAKVVRIQQVRFHNNTITWNWFRHGVRHPNLHTLAVVLIHTYYLKTHLPKKKKNLTFPADF